MMQQVAILGSTGSVGQSTLDVLSLHPEKYTVGALTAANNVAKMLEQCERFRPSVVAMAHEAAAHDLRAQLDERGITEIQVEAGANGICAIAESTETAILMSAIVGAAGLLPTLKAVQAGKRVLIANKEPLVMTGRLFMQEAKRCGATILPIDSEHNAIFQCMPSDRSVNGVNRVHLTASGGPFRGKKWQDLVGITPEQACAHPNWSMGRKISVDSATMMNKGLELIEAAALFGLAADRVDIIIHSQSIIHSLVEYTDGSFLAQLGAPDMKIPIAHALSWPDRIASGAKTLDLCEIARLDFEQPDMQQLPCLRLARSAAEAGGSAPAILNAANEIAVDAFLDGQIAYTDIPGIIEHSLDTLEAEPLSDIDHVLQIDNNARKIASRAIHSVA